MEKVWREKLKVAASLCTKGSETDIGFLHSALEECMDVYSAVFFIDMQCRAYGAV